MSWINNLSIYRKLLLGFLIILLLHLLQGVYDYSSLRNIHSNIKQSHETWLPLIDKIKDIEASSDLLREYESLLFEQSLNDKSNALKNAGLINAKIHEDYVKLREINNCNKTDSVIRILIARHFTYLENLNNKIQLDIGGNQGFDESYFKKTEVEYVSIKKLILALKDRVKRSNALEVNKLKVESNNIMTSMFVLTVLSVLIILLLSFLISQNIGKRIKKLIDDVREISNGNYDLEIKIIGSDDIGRLAESFSVMSEHVRSAIHNLNELNNNLELIVSERTNDLVEMNKHLHEEIDLKMQSEKANKRLIHEMQGLNEILKTNEEELRQNLEFTSSLNNKLIEKQEVLEKTSKWFYHIYENAPVMMYSINKNGRICNVNRRWLDKTGYSFEEIIGKPYIYVMDEESARRCTESVMPKFWDEGYINSVMCRYISKSGALMDVELSCVSTIDFEGNEISLSVAKDVTDSLRAENIIKELQERLLEASAMANLGHWKLDVKTLEMEWTDDVYRIFGLQPNSENANLELFLKYLIPEDSERVRYNVLKSIEDKDYYDDEFRFINLNEKRIAIIKSFIELDNQGNLRFLKGYIQDITEIRTQENEFREKEQRLRLLIKNSPDGISITDMQGYITFSSDNAVKMFGYDDVEETIGKHVLEFFHEESILAVKRGFELMLQGNLLGVSEYRGLKKNGEDFYFETNGMFIDDEAGNHKEMFFISRDISERKEMELQIFEQSNKLEDINKHLAERVAEEVEKNRKKEEMLLIQSRQAAMGEMIGNIAHQWRQPLNTIALIIYDINQAYKCKELTEAYMDKCNADLQRLTQNMSQTIDDFRDFFKPNKDKKLFSLPEAINKSIQFINTSFFNTNINIEFDNYEHLSIYGYPNEYAQTIINILNNAKDALLKENPVYPLIRITIEKMEDNACVKIFNNGGNIPKEIINKIFEPYFSTKGHREGSGIGLYMAKNIIEKNMGGYMEVENVNDGVEFRIFNKIS